MGVAARAMQWQGVCPVCGRAFELRGANHVYCTKSCEKKAYYRGTNNEMTSAALSTRVPRTLNCAKCGKEVTVRDPCDQRTRFCSERCERLYWKKPHRR